MKRLGRETRVCHLVNPRFDKLAEVYGARGFYVTRPDEIADAIKMALALSGPSTAYRK
jgi:thiamine pyrophosphate-dependent acetolactate synthase large subunit-like protein